MDLASLFGLLLQVVVGHEAVQRDGTLVDDHVDRARLRDLNVLHAGQLLPELLGYLLGQSHIRLARLAGRHLPAFRDLLHLS